MPTRNVFLLARRPEGRPEPDAFELVEEERPDPGPGEALVRTVYLSVDPYMRGRMRESHGYADPWAVGEPLRGRVVGEVVAADGAGVAAGDVVVGNLEWADYALARGEELTRVDPDPAPLSTRLGVLGMPGRTAYFGVREVAEPRPGDTMVFTGAAGAVGSVAGQLGGMAGARVVGLAGSDEKGRLLREELGFDAAINYAATDDYRAALDEHAPGGVDVYFDNVGGPITDAVFARLATDARVAVCGQISVYNETGTPTGPRKLWPLIPARARVEEFLVGDFEPRFDAATDRLAGWIDDGDLAYRETILDGLDRAPEAFLGLFDGENVGKMLVRVGAEP